MTVKKSYKTYAKTSIKTAVFCYGFLNKKATAKDRFSVLKKPRKMGLKSKKINPTNN